MEPNQNTYYCAWHSEAAKANPVELDTLPCNCGLPKETIPEPARVEFFWGTWE